jgi:hypothetical protein
MGHLCLIKTYLIIISTGENSMLASDDSRGDLGDSPAGGLSPPEGREKIRVPDLFSPTCAILPGKWNGE